MSLLSGFADWFEQQTTVEDWYADDEGRYAFRVTVDGTRFICAARSSTPGTETSVMRKVVSLGQSQNTLIALRLGDTVRVFDPDTVGACGSQDDAHDDRRIERGETWVYFKKSLGCRFEDWFDGVDAPIKQVPVDSF